MGWLHNELWQYVGPARASSYNHWQAHCHIFGPTMGWGTLAGSHWLGHTGWVTLAGAHWLGRSPEPHTIPTPVTGRRVSACANAFHFQSGIKKGYPLG